MDAKTLNEYAFNLSMSIFDNERKLTPAKYTRELIQMYAEMLLGPELTNDEVQQVVELTLENGF